MKSLFRFLFTCALSALLISGGIAGPFPFSFFKASGGGGGGGSATLVWSDNFDAYTPLEGLHSQTDWEAVSGGAFYISGTGGTVFSGSSAQYNGAVNVRTEVAAMTANQRVEATITDTDSGAYVGVGVRLGYSTGFNGYIMITNGTSLLVEKILIGVPTNMYVNASANLPDGTLIRLEVEDTGAATKINAYIDTDGPGGADWVAVVTDGVPTSPYVDDGEPGVAGYGAGDSFLDLWSTYQLP